VNILTLQCRKERLSTYWTKLTPLLDSIQTKDQLTFAHYNDVRMKKYHQGNILYIGDVAHGTSPQCKLPSISLFCSNSLC
jgi:2-polyprenyl-6-methoxyphenol hydroxylase-like FAD-dependent oxidoreductase